MVDSWVKLTKLRKKQKPKLDHVNKNVYLLNLCNQNSKINNCIQSGGDMETDKQFHKGKV